MKTAKHRIAFLQRFRLNDGSAKFVFEGYYASTAGILHTILLSIGFEAQNPICLGFYLRDVLGQDALFRAFDDCRYKRNGLVYYGEEMESAVAEQAVGAIRRLAGSLFDLYEMKHSSL